MTTQRPDPGAASQQVNTHGSTGFIGGNHVHNYGDYSAGTASQASRDAISRGAIVGRPIIDWDPGALGVHASITVHDETTLTPYLARGHDQKLRQALEQAAASAQASFVLIVGTSCSGKTRTLYEATRAVLPHWSVTAPRTDSDLTKALTDGIPTQTVVWLDELQDRLPTTPSGITAAKAITELLETDVGPIVFAGTIWPINRSAMQARPDPDMSTTGAGAIPGLLARAVVIDVPEMFTDTDYDRATIDDPRLQVAIDTATDTERPDHERKITQVLAGGTRLLQRLYPPGGTWPADRFSPAARAVLHAAGDLRRVGMPTPLPRWAIDGAVPGYLHPPDHRPSDQWLPAALDEVTKAARHEDRLTGSYTHDHHQLGVPALTPRWTITGDRYIEAYDLHDYLYQEQLRRYRFTPTAESLWACLIANREKLDTSALMEVARSAAIRGMKRIATSLLRPALDRGHLPAYHAVGYLVRDRQDADAQFARNSLQHLQENDLKSWSIVLAWVHTGTSAFQPVENPLTRLLLSDEEVLQDVFIAAGVPGTDLADFDHQTDGPQITLLRTLVMRADRTQQHRLVGLLTRRAGPAESAEMQAWTHAGVAGAAHALIMTYEAATQKQVLDLNVRGEPRFREG